jgi:hypothetical protein
METEGMFHEGLAQNAFEPWTSRAHVISNDDGVGVKHVDDIRDADS